jgi:hypothetical protein
MATRKSAVEKVVNAKAKPVVKVSRSERGELEASLSKKERQRVGALFKDLKDDKRGLESKVIKGEHGAQSLAGMRLIIYDLLNLLSLSEIDSANSKVMLRNLQQEYSTVRSELTQTKHVHEVIVEELKTSQKDNLELDERVIALERMLLCVYSQVDPAKVAHYFFESGKLIRAGKNIPSEMDEFLKASGEVRAMSYESSLD